MNPGIIGRSRRPSRRRVQPQRLRAALGTPVGIVSTDIAPTDRALTIVFDQNVAIPSLPRWPLADGRLPTSVNLTTPTTIVLSYTGEAVESITFTVPAGDESVRGYTGGTVAPGDYATGFVGAMNAAATEEPAPIARQAA